MMSVKQLSMLMIKMQRVSRNIPSRMLGNHPQLSPNRNIHTSFTAAADKPSKPVKLSSSLTLCRAPDKELNTKRSSPLVLFFPWLGATQSAIDRYLELYCTKGWDVLLIHSSAKHFVWPQNARTVVNEALDYVTSKEVLEERNDFLVHSMSIGAFTYTVMFRELQGNAEKYVEFNSKLKGQIFDSIVIGSPKQMGKGLADGVTKSSLGNLSVRAAFSLYLFVTKRWTLNHYAELVRHFYTEPVAVPTLVFYSLDDPNSDPVAMDNLIGGWRAFHPDMKVRYRSWSKSRHAAHLLLHRDDYISELDTYLTSIKMLEVQSHL